jgi:hypothetical protein
MKKQTYFPILVALILAIGLSSCEIYPAVEGNGIPVSETRKVSKFNKIVVDVNAEVYLRQGPQEAIVINSDENIVDNLETFVDNRVLNISILGHDVANRQALKIYIQVPDLYLVKVYGNAKVISENKFYMSDMDIVLNGSGFIDMAVDISNQIETNIGGSGIIYLEGDAYKSNHTISGSGGVEAFDLYSNYSDVSIFGSGYCETTVSNKLYSEITGSGYVYFKGSPIVKYSISGSGKIINSN